MNKVSEQVESFIAFKRGLGIKLKSGAAVLRQLAGYAASVGHEGPIDAELATEWARSGNHAPVYVASRYDFARQVADFSAVTDPSLPKLPPRLCGKVHHRVEPYIYTDEEVGILMRAAADIRFPADPSRAPACEFAIGFMRSTGIRPRELVALEDADYDSGSRCLTVRTSKSGAGRLLPLDDSVADALESYRGRRDALTGGAAQKLLARSGGLPMAVGMIEAAFVELRMTLLGRGETWGARRPPRLYDLRHTFAVAAIRRWHEEGADVNAMLPVLAAYMGHQTISETYWYLTGTPELMDIAGGAFHDYFEEARNGSR